MTIEVRPFRRDDREQVTALVNAHVQSVVPGVSLSVNAVMNQLEREPGEFIVDPWVADRATLVAVERQRVVAAAHLHRYADDERVGESYRDAGEIKWLLCWRDAPFWPDAGAGDVLAQACLAHLEGWGVGRFYADGALPGTRRLRRARLLAARGGDLRTSRFRARRTHGDRPRLVRR